MNQLEQDRIAGFELQLADCFRLLAACFYVPQKKVYQQERLHENLHTLLHSICPDAGIFSKTMLETFSSYTDEELNIEHARLFVGPYELGAAPYGSVYLEETRRVMGNTTTAALRMYEQAGLAMDKHYKEPPDHISVELEFMYFLSLKIAEALKKADSEQAGFYQKIRSDFQDQFLTKWVPPFCQCIKKNSSNEYYRALADCLNTFVVSHPTFQHDASI